MKYQRKGIAICLLFIICLASGGRAAAESTAGEGQSNGPATEGKKRWIGLTGSWGGHHHLWSATDYKGYKNKTAGVFMEWETEAWVPVPVNMEHTLRLELHYQDIWGTIPLTSDQVPPEKRNGGPYGTTLDHYNIALLLIRRWVFFPEYFIRPNLNLGFGISVLNKTVLEDGTIHNFNFVGGGGLEADINRQWSAFMDVRWEHFSNGGQIYLTNAAVIGLESINGVFGLRYRF